MKSLDLSHNSLDEQAGLHLGPAIAANEWLDSLNLSWNHLRHKGAYSVALALKVIFGFKDIFIWLYVSIKVIAH